MDDHLVISKWKKRIVGFLFDRIVYKGAASVWVTSEREAASVHNYGVMKPIDIIPIGLDISLYRSSSRNPECFRGYDIPQGCKVLLYFSRLTKIKGLDLLAEAWSVVARRHNDWRLVIAGPSDAHGYGKIAEDIFQKCCQKGTYRFIGPVYGDEKYSIFKSADLFILPSRGENFSIVVAESLASGVPVVCTKGAPWKRLEGDAEQGIGRSGWWIDLNVDAMVCALDSAMSLDDRERHEMGKNGVRLIESCYSWSVISAQMLRAYTNIL